jgi:hypothetical protein
MDDSEYGMRRSRESVNAEVSMGIKPYQKIAPQHCPTCGRNLNAVGVLDAPAPMPMPGDVTVCLECGALLEFGEGLTLTLVPESKLDDETLEEVHEIQRRIKAVKYVN